MRFKRNREYDTLPEGVEIISLGDQFFAVNCLKFPKNFRLTRRDTHTSFHVYARATRLQGL